MANFFQSRSKIGLPDPSREKPEIIDESFPIHESLQPYFVNLDQVTNKMIDEAMAGVPLCFAFTLPTLLCLLLCFALLCFASGFWNFHFALLCFASGFWKPNFALLCFAFGFWNFHFALLCFAWLWEIFLWILPFLRNLRKFWLLRTQNFKKVGLRAKVADI